MEINNIKVGDNTFDIAPAITEYDTVNDTAKVIKYGNGLMIITGNKIFEDVAMTTAWGVIYESALLSLGDYPEAFIETPVVVANPSGNKDCFIEVIKNRTGTKLGDTYFASATSKTDTVSIDYIAIGKWK